MFCRNVDVEALSAFHFCFGSLSSIRFTAEEILTASMQELDEDVLLLIG